MDTKNDNNNNKIPAANTFGHVTVLLVGVGEVGEVPLLLEVGAAHNTCPEPAPCRIAELAADTPNIGSGQQVAAEMERELSGHNHHMQRHHLQHYHHHCWSYSCCYCC